MSASRLLIVDADPSARESLRAMLEDRFELAEAGSVAQALQTHAQRPADCVILAQHLGELTGVEAVPRFADAAVVLLLSAADEGHVLEAMRQGAQDCVVRDAIGRQGLLRILEGALVRKRLERELGRKEEYNRALLRALPDATLRLGQDGTCLDYLPGSAGDHPWPPPRVGERIQDQLPCAPWTEHLAAALEGDLQTFDCVLPQGLGVLEVRLAACAPDEAVGVLRDVTEQRQLSQQLASSRQLEALGRLAGGVAHDFNNMLSVIMGHATFGQQRAPAEADAQRRFARILDACERSADLTQRLLAFGRMLVLQPRVVEVGSVLRETEALVARLLGEDLELRCASPSGLHVRVDPGQLHHALVNLALNARDAMPQGGALTIEASRVELDEAFARTNPDAAPGPYAVVQVGDTGSGMAPEVLERALEPFFTTKPKGQGTGLGLASVHGFIRQSGGFMTVSSELGIGSVFRLYLPEVDDEAPTTLIVRPASPAARGRTILVVEDEEPLRELAKEVLGDLGHDVLTAADGEEALDVLHRRGGELALVLTDMVLPKLGGRRVLAEARQHSPQAELICMSGYAPRTLEERGELEPDVVFVQKPFSPVELGRIVSELLEASGRG